MVLISYAQVCFGRLSFADNKGEDVTKYIKEGYLYFCQKPGYAPYLEGLAQILGR